MDDLSQSEYAQVEKGPSVTANYLLHFLPNDLQDRITSELPQEQRLVIETKKNQLQGDLVNIMKEYVNELQGFAQKILDEHEIDSTKYSSFTSADSDPALVARTPSSNSTDTLSVQSDERPERHRKSSLVKKPRSGSCSSAEDSVSPKPKKRVSFNLEADVTYFSSEDEPDATERLIIDEGDTSSDEYQFTDNLESITSSIVPAPSLNGSDIEQIEDVTYANDMPSPMETSGLKNDQLITFPKQRELTVTDEDGNILRSHHSNITKRINDGVDNEIQALREEEENSRGVESQNDSNKGNTSHVNKEEADETHEEEGELQEKRTDSRFNENPSSFDEKNAAESSHRGSDGLSKRSNGLNKSSNGVSKGTDGFNKKSNGLNRKSNKSHKSSYYSHKQSNGASHRSNRSNHHSNGSDNHSSGSNRSNDQYSSSSGIQSSSDNETSDDDVFQFDESMMPNQNISTSNHPIELPPDLDSGIASLLRSSVVDPALSMSLPSPGITPQPNSSRSYFGSRVPKRYSTNYSPSSGDSDDNSESSDVEIGNSNESMHASSLPINITIPQKEIKKRKETQDEVSARYGTLFSDESFSPGSPDFELMSLTQKMKWDDEHMKK